MSEVIGISVRTVRRMLTELVGAGLIRTRKQGKGLPQKIYVNTDTDDEALSQVDDQTASDRPEVAALERTEMAGQERTEMAALTIYQKDSYPDTIYPHPSAPAHTKAKGKGKESPSRKKEDEDDITQCIYKSDPSMTVDDVEEIKNRISRNKGFIHNTRAYIRTVVANYKLEKSIPAPQAKSQLAAYDLKAYEAESVFDYLSEEELAEIKAEAERLKR